MRKTPVLLAILALIASSLACQTLQGGGGDVPAAPPAVDNTNELPPVPTQDSSGGFDDFLGGEADFPMPDDASNVVSISGTVNFQTNLSLEEAMDFYRDVFGSQGYTEREILTVVSDTTFSMVFDGHESGEAIVVQGVDLGDGTTNVNVRLEDV
jgi:predicted small secreted protein